MYDTIDTDRIEISNKYFAKELDFPLWVEEARANYESILDDSRKVMSPEKFLNGFGENGWQPVLNSDLNICDYIPSMRSWLEENNIDIENDIVWYCTEIEWSQNPEVAIHTDTITKHHLDPNPIPKDHPFSPIITLNLPLSVQPELVRLESYAFRSDTKMESYASRSETERSNDYAKQIPYGTLPKASSSYVDNITESHCFYPESSVDLAASCTNVSELPVLLNTFQPHRLIAEQIDYEEKQLYRRYPDRGIPRLMLRFKNNPWHLFDA
tara:strand:+ start:3156 stop:3962 length:807 start_codon:yes stop_codon:yes gene_type:complete